MPFPNSPFDEGFDVEILRRLENDEIQNSEIDKLLKWLCETPKITSYRVNTILYSVVEVLELIEEELRRISEVRNLVAPKIYIHKLLPEVILIEHYNVNQLVLDKEMHEIIVDVHCAAAVLRGSHVFAPGVLGMTRGAQIDDMASIYADIAKKCKKGHQKVFTGEKIFIGNGKVKMQRFQLFGDNLKKPMGVAVEVIHSTSGCPPLGEDFLPKGAAMLQNIPSVVCVNVLNPLPGETVLDMCASPGNKTTHIAAKMNNEGLLVAIDKTPTKIKGLQENGFKFQAKVVIHQADSTKIYESGLATDDASNGPPFGKECFDRILLDAPCSALGKRPQLRNTDSEKVIKSFVPLQRKLFANAARLLKVNGTLVYSTCTITAAENEGLVAWALKTFDCLSLQPPIDSLGGKGWPFADLSEEQSVHVRRFGPCDQIDSVGFFVAKFVKTKS